MEAYHEQFTEVGWFQFSLGRISSKWSEAVRACSEVESIDLEQDCTWLHHRRGNGNYSKEYPQPSAPPL
jgi:hypothetical protein